MALLEITSDFRVLTVTRTDVDLLERFEQFRKRECNEDHSSFQPAEVPVPPISGDAEIRLLEYVENAEKAHSKEGRPTFGGAGYGSRGFLAHDLYERNSISTGTYWAGVVILSAISDTSYGVKIMYRYLDKSPGQSGYMQKIKEFFEKQQPNKEK